MAVFITAVQLAGGSQHEHIANLRWLDCGAETSNTFSTAAFVAWLQKGNVAYVADAKGKVPVQVVDGKPPYVRTVADSRYTDNLLSLPRF